MNTQSQGNSSSASDVVLSPQQLLAFQSLHESFARTVGKQISAVLDDDVMLRVDSVEQLRLSEYLFSREHPTCIYVLESGALESNWLLEFAPSLAYSLIDTMLGGQPGSEQELDRPLSELEWKVLDRAEQACLKSLNSVWAEVQPLSLRSGTHYSNPQLAQVAGPMDATVSVQFKVESLGKRVVPFSGPMSICIPYASIESLNARILSKFLSGTNAASGRRPKSDLGASSKGADTKIVVNLARSTISAADLMHLQVGDIVTTEQSVNDDLEVNIDGVGTYGGRVGSLKGRKAIEITRTPVDEKLDLAKSESLDSGGANESVTTADSDGVPQEKSVGEVGSEAA